VIGCTSMTADLGDPSDAAALVRARFPLVDDHPDVAGVLRQPELLRLLGPLMAAPFVDMGITVVCAPEARGPILGALVAVALDAGLMVARKDGRNHPGADRRVESGVTWRGTTETFIARSWDLGTDDRVLIVDDWVTTGNSIRALRDLVEQAGATYAGASALVDKTDPATRHELGMHSVVRFDDITGSTGD
jgi:adenine phosphoribosyltransferase